MSFVVNRVYSKSQNQKPQYIKQIDNYRGFPKLLIFCNLYEQFAHGVNIK